MERLSVIQVKLLCEAILSKKGYASPGSGQSAEWQYLLELGYVRKLPKRGMSDYADRYVATDLGTLRLTDPDGCVTLKVMGS